MCPSWWGSSWQGLVILGGVQAWWLEPVLTRLGDYAMVGATLLTAFNDNAAVTFLASTVPNLPEAVKYSVVAGAVTGGGLTVIANAPNPAGQAILGKYFKGINPPVAVCLGGFSHCHRVYFLHLLRPLMAGRAIILMFTGLVETTGTVEGFTPINGGARLTLTIPFGRELSWGIPLPSTDAA